MKEMEPITEETEDLADELVHNILIETVLGDVVTFVLIPRGEEIAPNEYAPFDKSTGTVIRVIAFRDKA